MITRSPINLSQTECDAAVQPISPVPYDHFPRYADLTGLLHSWAAQRPELCQLDRIGTSYQGRPIWLVSVTNTAAGPPADKPALLVEAGIHAAELTGTTAALHLLHRLLTEYGVNDTVTRLLDTRAFYVIPRLCPDGAEVVLTEGRYLRSSVRPYPQDEPEPGLHGRDIDGDGRVLFMRYPDPDGPWKVHPVDPRLLVPRSLDDSCGEHFRLLLEGEVLGYDGHTVPAAPALEGLDLAANFHSDWPDFASRPRGAGPYSGSEPEIASLMKAVVDRPNITGYVSCHTFGALHLHPPLNDDEDIPSADQRMYADLGAMATDLTGYPAMSYHALKHTPYRVRGGQLSWMYQERGILAWTTEIWNPLRAAGIEDFHPAKWLIDHPVADDLCLLAWNDAELAGKGFVDWYPFDHPQLGPVELGGWDVIGYWYNAPWHRLEAEVAPHTEWLIRWALASPLLAIRDVAVQRIGGDLHRISVVVANTGWLPTQVTAKAALREQCGPVRVILEIPSGTTLIQGGAVTELGQLAGRCHARTSTTWWGHDQGTPDLALCEWIVMAPTGAQVQVTAKHERAGVASATVVLEA